MFSQNHKEETSPYKWIFDALEEENREHHRDESSRKFKPLPQPSHYQFIGLRDAKGIRVDLIASSLD